MNALRQTLDNVFFILGQIGRNVEQKYDRAAPRYEPMHQRWLTGQGGEVITELQRRLLSRLRPGIRVLDAGCGTGRLARWIAHQEPQVRLTMLDLSIPMLLQAGDIWGRHMQGNVTTLPYSASEFDVVVCAWVLEAVPNPEESVHQLLRVLRPGGLLLCCYCTAPQTWAGQLMALRWQLPIKLGFGGSFLSPYSFPWLDQGQGQRFHSANGLATLIGYEKEWYEPSEPDHPRSRPGQPPVGGRSDHPP